MEDGEGPGSYGGEGPYVPGSDTSRIAALRAQENAAAQRALVLAFLHSQGTVGATSEEIEHGAGIPHQSAGPRIRELRAAKDTKIAVLRETRLTSFQRPSHVLLHREFLSPDRPHLPYTVFRLVDYDRVHLVLMDLLPDDAIDLVWARLDPTLYDTPSKRRKRKR